MKRKTNRVPDWLQCVYFIGLYGIAGLAKCKNIQNAYNMSIAQSEEENNNNPVVNAFDFLKTHGMFGEDNEQ